MSHTAAPTRFSDKDPEEVLILTFNFSELTAAVTLPDVSITRKSGTADASPGNVLDGAPSISGAKVLQRVKGGTAGTDYALRCKVTADGQTYVLSAILPVRTA